MTTVYHYISMTGLFIPDRTVYPCISLTGLFVNHSLASFAEQLHRQASTSPAPLISAHRSIPANLPLGHATEGVACLTEMPVTHLQSSSSRRPGLKILIPERNVTDSERVRATSGVWGRLGVHMTGVLSVVSQGYFSLLSFPLMSFLLGVTPPWCRHSACSVSIHCVSNHRVFIHCVYLPRVSSLCLYAVYTI